MPNANSILPTGLFESWTVTSLRDSIIAELGRDRSDGSLRLFFYAVTESGWSEVGKAIQNWMRGRARRKATLLAGTDHGITDPLVLWTIQQTGIEVRVMETYHGVYHPKVVWLGGGQRNLVWVASNNLTRDGLLNNIEFAALIRARGAPRELTQWSREIEASSSVLTKDLLDSYKAERSAFQARQAKAKTTTFTWSKKAEPAGRAAPAVRRGDLILEIMPEETRGGNQIQIPKEAARRFFGLKRVGDQRAISLFRLGSKSRRRLIVTVFANNTVRLSVNELEHGDRPCVIVFRKAPSHVYSFDIVPESTFPSRYRALLAMCNEQTRSGSRRWAIR